jgi:phenylacetate-CoA ligase
MPWATAWAARCWPSPRPRWPAAAATPPKPLPPLASLTLLAAQTDFSEPGELGLFIDESQVGYLDEITRGQGFLSGRQMAGSFQFLHSRDLVWTRRMREYLMGEREAMSDLMAWNADTTRMPARMHHEYLTSLYLHNALAAWRLPGRTARPVSLADLRTPVFVVGTERDHVSPWRSVYKLHHLCDSRSHLRAGQRRAQRRHRQRTRPCRPHYRMATGRRTATASSPRLPSRPTARMDTQGSLAGPFGGRFGGPLMVTLDVVQAQHADRAAVEGRQQRRLQALLKSARERVPRYRQLLQGVDLERLALEQLPRSDKSMLMADFEGHLSDPTLRLDGLRRFCADPAQIGLRFDRRCWAWESSGSSGVPALYVQDSDAMTVYDALEACRRHPSQVWRRWLDPWYLGERFAFVGATGGHFASVVSVQRLRRMHPSLQTGWRCFSLLEPMPALCAALDDFAPTLLATYPTAAVALAEQVRSGRLQHCRPREVWTGGEALTPAMRSRIESAFGCEVRQSYGASEFLPIAWECRAQGLHVNADWVILEPVDAQGRRVPPGRRSHTTLLTNLANHLQPLVRFDIGDRIVLDERPCRCGSALPLVRVEGRCDDAIVLPMAPTAPHRHPAAAGADHGARGPRRPVRLRTAPGRRAPLAVGHRPRGRVGTGRAPPLPSGADDLPARTGRRAAESGTAPPEGLAASGTRRACRKMQARVCSAVTRSAPTVPPQGSAPGLCHRPASAGQAARAQPDIPRRILSTCRRASPSSLPRSRPGMRPCDSTGRPPTNRWRSRPAPPAATGPISGSCRPA